MNAEDNEMFGTFNRDRPYLTKKFRRQVCDPATGQDNETIKKNVMALAEELRGLPHPVVKARAFEYVIRNVQIGVSPNDWFVCFGCWDRNDRPLNPLLAQWHDEVDEKYPEAVQRIRDLNRSGAANIWKDFDHSVPDWDAVFALGFPGLLERIRRYRLEMAETLDDAARAYYDGLEITYGAIIEMLQRFHAYALAHAGENGRIRAVARCLETLVHGAPTNTYEVLQLVYLYFMFSEHLDRMQVRSLGNLDRTVYPYFIRDLQEGLFTEPQIREFLSYFLMQWASINNYWGHPFYFGGTRADGTSEINTLSYLILDEFDKLDICSPKLQLKIAPNTPVAFVDKALDMIRRGHNSIVFVGEPGVKRALMGLGYSETEARTCDITGCYEFTPRARSNQTGSGYINMLKPYEFIFNEGRDPGTGIDCGCPTTDIVRLKTFDDFYRAYIVVLGDLIEQVIDCIKHDEMRLNEINPAQVYSGTIENSLRTARDAFHTGSVYNVTGILMVGFATAVDALMAIREFVYEKRMVTLPELRKALKNNWKGYEKLRSRILNSTDKFGNGIESVDFHAGAVARFIANKINLRPNSRGGFFVASLHPARQFIVLGEKTGATPDGRLAGEEMSKNVSPTMGMDRNGVTALVKSVTGIDSALFPGDFPLDVMLHPATVRGEDGLAAMRTLLNTYIEKNGLAVHFNIFDAEVLLDAQRHPEKYESLQVRICGWNARFNDIARKEQDAYIKRAMSIA